MSAIGRFHCILIALSRNQLNEVLLRIAYVTQSVFIATKTLRITIDNIVILLLLQKRVYNPVAHLRWSFIVKVVNVL